MSGTAVHVLNRPNMMQGALACAAAARTPREADEFPRHARGCARTRQPLLQLPVPRQPLTVPMFEFAVEHLPPLYDIGIHQLMTP